MSFTEIIGFDNNGDATLFASIKNSWQGGMAIWGILEERHLPQYIPDYVKYCNWYRPDMSVEEIIRRNGFKPTRCTPSMGSGNPTQEIWNLANNTSIAENDRICLCTTFDYVVVKKEYLPRVMEAFRSFSGETSLPEQADVLNLMYNNENCSAVAWCQTSVASGIWSNYDDESDEETPYNLNTGDKHWFLFDDDRERWDFEH